MVIGIKMVGDLNDDGVKCGVTMMGEDEVGWSMIAHVMLSDIYHTQGESKVSAVMIVLMIGPLQSSLCGIPQSQL